jgi:hypothetical protein
VSVQETPRLFGSKLTVAVNCCVVSSATVEGFGVTETLMAAKVIVMTPDFVESLADLAEIVTCTSLCGGVAGAVYITEVLVGLLRVPAPVAGEILQEAGSTPLFAGSLLTMAVICDVPPAPTGFTDATSETKMAAKSMLTGADCAGSAAEVAVMVTVTSLGGGVAGAL